VVRYHFGTEDLVRTRFAISPLFELTWSLDTLRDTGGHALHLPWARAAAVRLKGLDISLLEAIMRGGTGYVPDFTSPPPTTPLADLDGDLRRVAQTPPDVVRRELALAWGDEPPPPGRALYEDPEQELPRLAALMRAYWDRALAPWWPRIRTLLEDDVARRARRLTERGTIGVFDDLHDDVRWTGDRLEMRRGYEFDVALNGRGLLLVPAVFAWPRVFAMTDEPWQPAVVYPPRGVGALWEPSRRAPKGGLARPLGERRARVLHELGAPATTTDLAERLDASAAGISHHLRVLHDAGLVRCQRDGRRVLYVRTDAGDALVS
jgi:hypothetical protein